MVVNLSEWRSQAKKKYYFQVKCIVQGTGELFNASFFLKAQDHFRATKPGAGTYEKRSSHLDPDLCREQGRPPVQVNRPPRAGRPAECNC